MRFIKELKKYWYFVFYTAKSDLRAEVAGSYLNWLWWILEPLSSMIIYAIVFGMFFHSNELYYPAFIFVAVILWDFFSRCTTTSVDLMRINKHIISRIYMPKYIILIERMVVLFFKMIISCIILIPLLIIYKVNIGLNILFIIPILIDFFVFCFAIGTFMLHFGVYISDLSNLLKIALNLMFYITGIFYTIQTVAPEPFGYLLQRINPIAYFIFCARKAILYNERPSVLMLFVWFVISMLLAYGGIRLIRKNENGYVKMV